MIQVEFSRHRVVKPQKIDRARLLWWRNTSLEEIVRGLPETISRVLGEVINISLPQSQGYCSMVCFIHAAGGKFALKIAQNGYRADELYAEYLALKVLGGTSLPIPQAFAYANDERGHYLLSSYCEGVPLSVLLRTTDDEEYRLQMVGQMAETLARVHNIGVQGATWEGSLEAQLKFARRHLEYENIDPDEFMENSGEPIDPHAVLRWLIGNRPPEGKVCLLHGDYRPKNMLWQGNRLSCLVDWAFCDAGDPYYDLGIVWYYLKTDKEKEHFLRCYGLGELDEERLRYFELLAKFTNV